MFSPYVTAAGPGTTSRDGTPSRFPALPPDTANAAATTARHATTRRQRACFIVSPSRCSAAARTPRAGRLSCQTTGTLATARGARPRARAPAGATMRPPGDVAEWLGRGLQSLVQRFESARRLISDSREPRSPGQGSDGLHRALTIEPTKVDLGRRKVAV